MNEITTEQAGAVALLAIAVVAMLLITLLSPIVALVPWVSMSALSGGVNNLVVLSLVGLVCWGFYDDLTGANADR